MEFSRIVSIERERKRVDDGLPVRKSELNVKITFIGADWPPCVGSCTVDGSFSDRLCGKSVVENVNFEGYRFQSFRYIKLKVNILGEPQYFLLKAPKR